MNLDAVQPSTLFENGQTRVTLRARDPAAHTLVVTFNFLSSNNVEDLGYAEGFFWGHGMDVLSVKCRDNRWFQDLSPSDFQSVMDSLSYDEVLSYGVSMGAYGALAFSRPIGARAAILFSPQFSPDPAFVPWETRWPEARGATSMQHPPPAGLIDPKTRYAIIYDPRDVGDARHVAAIVAAAPPGHVQEIRMHRGGHEAVMTVHGAGLLERLNLSLMGRDHDLPAVLAELHRKRRKSWIYAFSLAWSAIHRKKRFARAVVEEALRRARTPYERLAMVEPMLAAGWIEGLTHVAPHIDLHVEGRDARLDQQVERARELIADRVIYTRTAPAASIPLQLEVGDRLFPRTAVLCIGPRADDVAAALRARACLTTALAPDALQAGPPTAAPVGSAGELFSVILSSSAAHRLDDEALERQVRFAVDSLKPGGLFSLDYAVDLGGGGDWIWDGVVGRSQPDFNALVERAGGRVIQTFVRPDVDARLGWRVAHVVRPYRPPG